ncbi:MAG: nickel transporter [Pseudomonadota bacterium]|jgi:high-affinity nickel-transport protein
MEPLPTDWPALMLLVFALGLKHGVDADHLATIDGLTRYNARDNPRLARWCGFLFSLGHGTVVVAIALVVGSLARTWQVPGWMEDVGAWISIGFLTLLGAMNLTAVLTARPDEVVRPVGVKGRLFRRLQHNSHPLLIALVGAFFALSFDTMSQAALFALTGTRFGGWGHSLILGLLFMLGMMTMDGVNGLWISRLIRRTDQLALVASRIMGLVVASLSLLVALFGALKYFSPAVDGWSEGKELAFGIGVIFAVASSFLLALRLARGAASRPRSAHDFFWHEV